MIKLKFIGIQNLIQNINYYFIHRFKCATYLPFSPTYKSRKHNFCKPKNNKAYPVNT